MDTHAPWPAIQLLWQLVAMQLSIYGLLWWLLAPAQAASRRSLRLFACFNWLLAADLLLVGFRFSGDPGLVTRVLANLFAIAAFVSLWLGGIFRHHVSCSVKEPFMVAGLSSIAVIAIGLSHGQGSVRTAVVLITIAWLIFRAWWMLKELYAQRHGKTSASVLGVLACVIVGVLAVKAWGGLFLGWHIEFDQQHPGAMLTVYLVSALTTFLNCLLAYTEIKRLVIKFQGLALQDPLTLIANRRAFNDQLDVRWAAWRRAGSEFWVLCVDIDNFKLVNDRFGHQVGDSVLVAVTQALRAQVRLGDCIARTGGEEFTLLVSDASRSTVAELAERLRQAVERQVKTPDGKQVHISMGVACCEPTDFNPGETVARADIELYRAKGLGRNRVVIASPGPAIRPIAA